MDFCCLKWSGLWWWWFCGGGGFCGNGCGGGLTIGFGCGGDSLVVGATNDEAMGTEAFAGSKFRAVS